MTQHIGFRCPEDIIAAIKARTEASGKPRTDVLIDMLRASMPSTLVSDRNKLPQERAIYFVWNEEQLLYIGKTDNLRDRFSNHPKLPNFVLAGIETRVSWLPATDDNLAAFESSLIEELEPEFNQATALGEDKSRVVSFRLPQELEARIVEQSQQGESFNDTAKRILIEVLGGQTISLPLPQLDIQELIAEAITERMKDINNNIEGIIEKLFEEKTTHLPAKIPSNIPNQTQFQEMHSRINDFRGSLLREIQNRDKSINLFAEQIAELTYRLDNMPSGVSREELEKARDKILQNWRTAKGVEKKERIKQGIDKVIDEIYPQE